MTTIKFKLQESPLSKGKEVKSYYPVVANENKLSAKDFCRLIHDRCTLTESDIWAVMMNAAQLLVENLSNGTRVEMPVLGTFAPSIVSDGAITDLDDKLIARRLRIDTIDFSPRSALIKDMQGVNFHRAEHMVKSRVDLSHQELLEHIQALCEESPMHSFNREDFQSKTHFSRTRACRMLRQLTEEGVLLKLGKRNAPYYTLRKEDRLIE